MGLLDVRYYQYWRAAPERHIGDSFMTLLYTYARSYKKEIEHDEIGQPISYAFRRIEFAEFNYVDQKYGPARGDVVDGMGTHLPWWMLVEWSVKSAIVVGI